MGGERIRRRRRRKEEMEEKEEESEGGRRKREKQGRTHGRTSRRIGRLAPVLRSMHVAPAGRRSPYISYNLIPILLLSIPPPRLPSLSRFRPKRMELREEEQRNVARGAMLPSERNAKEKKRTKWKERKREKEGAREEKRKSEG